MGSLILPAIHLSVLLGYIFYKTKKPFLEFVRSRHLEVSDGLNKSKKQAINVEAKRKEVEARLSGLEVEKKKIILEWKEKEAQQILTIQQSTQRILNQMKLEAEQNKKSLSESVRTETLKGIGMLVLAQAESKIKAGLNKETHQKLNQSFSEVVGLS